MVIRVRIINQYKSVNSGLLSNQIAPHKKLVKLRHGPKCYYCHKTDRSFLFIPNSALLIFTEFTFVCVWAPACTPGWSSCIASQYFSNSDISHSSTDWLQFITWLLITTKYVQIRCNWYTKSPLRGPNLPHKPPEATFSFTKSGQPVEPQASHEPSSGRRSICPRSLDRKRTKCEKCKIIHLLNPPTESAPVSYCMASLRLKTPLTNLNYASMGNKRFGSSIIVFWEAHLYRG